MQGATTAVTTHTSTSKQEMLAIFLALIAGYTDAAAFIHWKTYVSFMSGNTTQAGFSLAQGNYHIAALSVTAIVTFATGIYTGTVIQCFSRYNKKALLLRIVALLIILCMVTQYMYSMPALAAVGMLAFAMGLMNTIIATVGKQAVNTDFVTGIISSMARQAALYSTATNYAEKQQYKSHAVQLLFIWLSFITGAAIAVPGIRCMNNWALSLPALLLLLVSPFVQDI